MIMTLKLIYSLFIGVLFSALVGFGIAAFYVTPKEPEYPSELKVARPEERVSESVFIELKSKQAKYDEDFKAFQGKMETYSRNVALIAISASVVTLVVSLTFFKRILLIADGLLLGGVLTLLYSIVRGLASGSDKFRFVLVAAAFIIAVILGYVKLIKAEVKPRFKRR